MLNKAKTLKQTLVNLRRTIHMHPELGFEEHQTSNLVAKTLTDLGLEIQTRVGKTGVIAKLGNGDGPVIGIRADMDALPIEEANDVPYKSKIPGKMHACGHDAHTAMLLGAAMLLKEEDFNGEIRLLFQPSEEKPDDEGISGAPRMIEDGAIEGLEAVIALHVDGKMNCGRISLGEGYVLANVDTIFAQIIGKGGHGAVPHKALDPIFMTGPILSALHGIVSRYVNPTDPAVITVGRIHGGAVANVIPAHVELDITLRSITDETRELLITEVKNALSIAKVMGGDYKLKLVRGYPALYNHPTVVNAIRETASQLIGTDNIQQTQLTMGAEDFAFMARASQGAMLFLGVKQPNGPEKHVHHPEFDIDEDALPIGAALLAQTALSFVKGK